MIRVAGLTKKINGTTILHSVSLELPPGKVLGIIGSSGGGKTTLLLSLSGLSAFDAGEIRINGNGISPADFSKSNPRLLSYRKHIGIVFQHLYLFPHLSVIGNIIEAPVHVSRLPVTEAYEKAITLLKRVGLSAHADKYPEQLSGGEQQRVAICRALAMNPSVLLLDEPTSALDPKRSADIRELLIDYVAAGNTLIVVSHSLGFLKGFADYLAFMDQGEIIEYNTAKELLESPQDERTVHFLMHSA